MWEDVKEFLEDLKKSSQVLDESVAVLSIFRGDRFRPRSVLEELLHVLLKLESVVSGLRDDRFESRASRSGSFDVRSSLAPAMEKLLPRRCWLRA